jgi:hypothetical protein
MTRKIAGTCLAAVLGFALTAAAQEPAQAAPQTPPPTPQTAPASPYPSSQSSDMSSMSHGDKKASSLTGCVQSGTTAGTFELSNIKGKMGSMAADTSASAGATTPSASGKTVKLVAAAGVDLSQHVGHQVELKGSWDKAAMSAPTSPDPSASASAPAAAPAGADKAFNVTDVKMVSATCSAGTN